MIKVDPLEKLAKKLHESLPPSLQTPKTEIEKHFKAILQAECHKMDLVTREEFDIQTKILDKCRLQLVELEKRLADLSK